LNTIPQKTLKSTVIIKGVGLHSGETANLILEPATANHGIKFIRTDVDKKNIIELNPANIVYNDRRTQLTNGNVNINTIEHLLAVLHILGITELTIKCDCEELPGCDGSGKIYLEKIDAVGIETLGAETNILEINTPLTVDSEHGNITAIANKDFIIDYTLDYSAFGVSLQHKTINITEQTFREEIVNCRTFCMKQEWDQRLEHNLGKGASLENTLVMDKDTPLENKFNQPLELSCHKILDLIGDLYLTGQPVKGKFIALKSGHAANVELTQKIFNQRPTEPVYHLEELLKVLPHRYPMMMVDRLEKLEPKKRAVGYKNLSFNEPFFQGHFPGQPVMPGVLQIEAMAQLAGCILIDPNSKTKLIPMFTAIDGVKFRRPVVPGDRLDMDTRIVKFRRNMGEVIGKATVNGQVASEATFRFILIEGPQE